MNRRKLTAVAVAVLMCLAMFAPSVSAVLTEERATRILPSQIDLEELVKEMEKERFETKSTNLSLHQYMSKIPLIHGGS